MNEKVTVEKEKSFDSGFFCLFCSIVLSENIKNAQFHGDFGKISIFDLFRAKQEKS